MKEQSNMRYGAIEAGGTKFVLAVIDEDMNVVTRERIDTRLPAETLADVFTFFEANPVDAIGIGSFGPIDINPKSATYGHVKATPKPGWRDFDFLGAMKTWRDIPYFWTTDVNVAAVGEQQLGAAKGINNLVYLTIGTGIGAGIIHNGQLLSGFGHPEAGHISLHQHPDDTEFKGVCPYHGTCFEGLAAGPSLQARYGVPAVELGEEHAAWQVEAYYIAQALVNYSLILSPERIVLGGGVMHQHMLFPMIRESFAAQMADYAQVPNLDEYIQPIALADDAGVLGCALLAKQALKQQA